MFESFTPEAITVIVCAQEESRRMGHNYLGTEQMLLGLISEGTSVAAKALKSMGVNLKDARIEVKKIIGRGSGFIGVEIPFTPEMVDIMELSVREAHQSQRNVDTEHLLLNLFREISGENSNDNIAVKVLNNLGLDSAKIQSQINNPDTSADVLNQGERKLSRFFKSIFK
jgi:ATP-dependent Clp protease ATP-binding subunit ClpC